MSQHIREYWNSRALGSGGSSNATTNDVYLRELEFTTIVYTLRELVRARRAIVLDLGCGDGHTTLRIARALPNLRVRGIDYAREMVAIAESSREQEDESVRSRVEFGLGDATHLDAACGDTRYDVIITDRCLINLGTRQRQYDALAQIANHLKPGGYYLGIENFVEGQESLNRARAAMGLPEIPVRWHNLLFREEDFRHHASRHFEAIRFEDFASAYYFATRVVYSAVCRLRQEEPDYHHAIHQIAPRLPWFGQFSPVRMALLRRRRDGAPRRNIDP